MPRPRGQTEDDSAQDGEGEGVGHWTEHLTTDAREKEYGHEHYQDDQLSEKGRVHHCRCRLITDVIHVSLGESMLMRGKFAFHLVYNAFDDDNCSIHDDTEVDSPEAHQVGPHPKETHENKCKEQ